MKRLFQKKHWIIIVGIVCAIALIGIVILLVPNNKKQTTPNNPNSEVPQTEGLTIGEFNEETEDEESIDMSEFDDIAKNDEDANSDASSDTSDDQNQQDDNEPDGKDEPDDEDEPDEAQANWGPLF